MSIRTEIGLTTEKLEKFNIHNITLVCPNCKNTGREIEALWFKFRMEADIEYFHYWLKCKKCSCNFSVKKTTIPNWY